MTRAFAKLSAAATVSSLLSRRLTLQSNQNSNFEMSMKVGGGVGWWGCPTVFLFDWDDTLCASTAANQMTTNQTNPIAAGGNGADANPDNNGGGWRALAYWVRLLLAYALRIAPDGVYLVTNSQEGWVPVSVERFMPELKPIMSHVKVISSRSLYATPAQELSMAKKTIQESDLVGWKYRAFLDILRTHSTNSTIVAMGDSPVEIKALEMAADTLKIATTKSVKFTPEPTMQSLIDQVKYVYSVLPSILWYKAPVRVTLNPETFSNIPKQNPFLSLFSS